MHRCVSKNIFIGISTAEGKLDNYVGCDRFGWGFLANRAVWHNKSKYKNFGELFRSGDTVSVILDLDLGTLAFILNGVVSFIFYVYYDALIILSTGPRNCSRWAGWSLLPSVQSL